MENPGLCHSGSHDRFQDLRAQEEVHNEQVMALLSTHLSNKCSATSCCSHFLQVRRVVRHFKIQIHPQATTITATFSSPDGPRIALDLWKKLLLWDREVRHFGDSVEHLLEGQDSRHLSVNTKMLQVFSV